MEKYTIFVMRKFIIDVALLILVGGVMYKLTTVTPFQRGFFCGDESLMYPYRPNTISSHTLHLVGILLPIITIIVGEIWTLCRRKEDSPRCLGVPVAAWVRGCYSVLVTFGMGLLCIELATNVSKVTIGRLRPCFMDVCRPSVNCSSPDYQHRYIRPEEFKCTNSLYPQHTMRDIRLSFMSGHSSWAAYTMVFVALYLHKRMTWKATPVPRLLLQFTVLMMAFFTALSRVSDNKHHWSDVLAGFTTGTIFAIIAVTWCTQWVERRDHSPLPQHDSAPSTAIGQRS